MSKAPSAIRLKEKIALIIFGLVIGLVLLESGLWLGGWAFLSFQEHSNKAVSGGKNVYRILCLGESTTARTIEFDEGESSYPSQLQGILNQGRSGKKFIVINAGVPGITTTGIVRQLSDNLNEYNPDIVIAMMGINDRGNILPYESTHLTPALSFLKEFKIYKLAALLWLHCIDKLSELRDEDCFPRDERFTREFEKEKARLKQAIEMNPGDSRGYLALGSYYLGLARFRDAEEALKKAIAVDDRNDTAYFELGKCSFETARFREAEAMFQKAIAINPQNHKAYLGLSLYYLSEGRLHDIEEMLKGVIEKAPEDDKAYALLGRYYHYVGREKEAEEILKKSIKLNAQNYDSLLALGQYYSETARFPEAEATYDKLDGIQPKTHEEDIGLGYCYLQAGRFRRGETLILRAIARDPQNYRLYHFLGYNCYKAQRRNQEAENILKKAIAINPERSEAYLGLGRFYIKEGRYREAVMLFKKACNVSPISQQTDAAFESFDDVGQRSLAVGAQFGSYFLSNGRFREAEKIFRKIIEINPRNYEIYLQLGRCYRALGDFDSAEGCFRKAMSINPGESRAYFRLGSLYKLGCLYRIADSNRNAEQVWRKGLEKNKKNYYICAELAQLYLEEKRSQEAEKIFKHILDIDPQNHAIFLELGSNFKPAAQSAEAEEALGKESLLGIRRYIKRAERLDVYKQSTIDNFRRLKAIVQERGIRLIVVQYPSRSIAPLKDIFEDKTGIIFVDNEQTFQEALRKSRYSEYFNDHFAGDFGHCTRKGNRLLAENIAKAVIQAGY
jgi:tetratricopeptide (TPR) repeat protein